MLVVFVFDGYGLLDGVVDVWFLSDGSLDVLLVALIAVTLRRGRVARAALKEVEREVKSDG